MELLVNPEMLTSYTYGPTIGNAESCLQFSAQWSNTESMQSGVRCRSCVKTASNQGHLN